MSDEFEFTRNGLVTEKTWADYVEENSYTSCGFINYLEATEDMVLRISKIANLETAQSFEELKQELLNLCNERTQFLKYAHNNTP